MSDGAALSGERVEVMSANEEHEIQLHTFSLCCTSMKEKGERETKVRGKGVKEVFIWVEQEAQIILAQGARSLTQESHVRDI